MDKLLQIWISSPLLTCCCETRKKLDENGVIIIFNGLTEDENP